MSESDSSPEQVDSTPEPTQPQSIPLEQLLFQRGQALGEILDKSGLPADLITVNALAIMLIDMCIGARFPKKAFMKAMQQNWKQSIRLRKERARYARSEQGRAGGSEVHTVPQGAEPGEDKEA